MHSILRLSVIADARVPTDRSSSLKNASVQSPCGSVVHMGTVRFIVSVINSISDYLYTSGQEAVAEIDNIACIETERKGIH